MSAELGTKKDGRYDAITGGASGPAWWDRDTAYHQERSLTSDDIRSNDVLTWEPSLVHVYDEKGKEIPDYRRVVRSDNGATIGCGMKKGYALIGHRKMFEVMDSLMQDGIMKYASAGSLGNGERVFIVGEIPSAQEEIIPGDRVNLFVTMMGFHNGGGSNLLFPNVTRTVCANTWSVAIRERDGSVYKGVRHSGDTDAKLYVQRNVILANIEAFHAYNADCRKLANEKYSKADAEQYIATLFPVPTKDGKPVTGRSLSIRNRKVKAVRDAFQDDSNQLGGMKGTYWQLANAVTFAVDHGDIFAWHGGDNARKRFENKFQSVVLNGQGSKLKTQAMDLALNMAGVTTAA